MAITYQKQKGLRLKRYGLWIITYASGYWYCDLTKKWIIPDDDRWKKGHLSNTQKCNTIRAFRRALRKNPILNELGCIWVNAYMGYCAYANKTEVFKRRLK